MTVNTEKIDGRCRLRIEGEMTVFNAIELKKDLLDAMNECSELEMDLSLVNEFDTAGLQLLISAKCHAANLNKPYRIVSYSPAATAVLDLLDMKGFFEGD